MKNINDASLKKLIGSTEIRTQVSGFKVPRDNQLHYRAKFVECQRNLTLILLNESNNSHFVTRLNSESGLTGGLGCGFMVNFPQSFIMRSDYPFLILIYTANTIIFFSVLYYYRNNLMKFILHFDEFFFQHQSNALQNI